MITRGNKNLLIIRNILSCCSLLAICGLGFFSISSIETQASTPGLSAATDTLIKKGSVRLLIREENISHKLAVSNGIGVNNDQPKPDLQESVSKQTEKIENNLKNNINTKNIKKSKFSSTVSVTIDNYNQLRKLAKLYPQIQEDRIHFPTLMNSNLVIGAPASWNAGPSGSAAGKYIAILDTGIQANHPFLTGKVGLEACFSSSDTFYKIQSSCPRGTDTQFGAGAAAPCKIASCEHGTHVAGIAAGKYQSSLSGQFHGVAKDAKILSIQVFSIINNPAFCNSSPNPCIAAFDSDIIEGLNYVGFVRSVQDNNNWLERLASVNMSLGFSQSSQLPCDSDPIKPAIDNLKNAYRIATVVAAGNSAQFGISSPGCISSAISVGATDNQDVKASFSNYSPNMSFFAPGYRIISSYTGSNYAYMSGTSMSAPMVAGAMAIMSAKFPNNTVDQNVAILKSAGKPISYTNNGQTYESKRLVLCQNYVFIDNGWRCG